MKYFVYDAFRLDKILQRYWLRLSSIEKKRRCNSDILFYIKMRIKHINPIYNSMYKVKIIDKKYLKLSKKCLAIILTSKGWYYRRTRDIRDLKIYDAAARRRGVNI